jgi:hypothetical protein
MEQTYSNYTNRILNLHQAKIYGDVIAPTWFTASARAIRRRLSIVWHLTF